MDKGQQMQLILSLVVVVVIFAMGFAMGMLVDLGNALVTVVDRARRRRQTERAIEQAIRLTNHQLSERTLR